MTKKNFFRRSLGVLSSVLLTGSLLSTAVLAGTYLGPVGAKESDIMTVDFRADTAPEATYWAVMNWNAGDEGGGYAGFQMHANNRTTVHFSEWESKADPKNKFPSVEYTSPISKGEKFGGEGEGVKIPTDYKWQPNKWYNMTMRTWQENGQTKIGQWVKNHEDGTWLQTGVINFPIADIYFKSGHGMFQEDFWTTDYEKQNGDNDTQASLKNSYGRDRETGQWNSWYKQNASAQDQYINAQNKGWAAGLSEDKSSVWIGMGGTTKNNGVANNTVFEIDQPATPSTPPSDFSIDHAVHNNGTIDIKWTVPAQATPQFSVKIDLYDNASYTGTPFQTMDGIKSYEREIKSALDSTLSASNGKTPSEIYAKITLTDLFDNTVVKKTPVTKGSQSDYVPNEQDEDSSESQNESPSENRVIPEFTAGFNESMVAFAISPQTLASNRRIIAFYNGEYFMETHAGVNYYSERQKVSSDQFYIIRGGVKPKPGDVVELYEMPGRPGSSDSKSQGKLLRKSTYLEMDSDN